MTRPGPNRGSSVLPALLGLACLVATACSSPVIRPPYQSFETPEDAVAALNEAVSRGSVDDIVALFGPEGRSLIDESDPLTARRNRDVYLAAVSEGWRLIDADSGKELVIGNEAWPFPVPLTKDAFGWRFNTARGREEILARRIGRNELKVLQICAAYVAAQRAYAARGHDGREPGAYAQVLRSDPGRHNGLYWPAEDGAPRSPIGDLLPQAADEGRVPAAKTGPVPFHGYYFRILTAQGDAAPDGARDYVVNGEMRGGFALVAWPAHYDSSGVMTFIVNHDAVVHEQDLGRSTDAVARAMTRYDPDSSWSAVDRNER